MEHLLSGFTVLDFTHFLAGPSCSRLFAELGADVVKVEAAPSGDAARVLPFVKDGRSGYFVQQNRGKKSVCIDLRDPRGLEAIKKLLPKVDVVLENFSAGTIGRLGLGWDVVHAINPRTVMCSITTFGQTGPLAKMVGYDPIAQAFAGITELIGEKGGPPAYPMFSLGDTLTGAHAFGAISAALLYREKSGKGQYLDISLLDCYFHHHDITTQVVSLSEGAMIPTRNGRHHFALAPTGIFRGRDRFMFIVALEHQWGQFCKVIGHEELIADPRFSDNSKRVENVDALVEIVESWIQGMDSDEAAMEALMEGRIPVGPILTVKEAMEHPHHIARGTVRKISDRVLPDFHAPGNPLRFSDFPDSLDLDAPFLGEHNREVLGDYLGYSDSDITTLEREGVLQREPLPGEAGA